MSLVLDGFSLDTKAWGEFNTAAPLSANPNPLTIARFNVDFVSDVCLNLTVFDHLVLPENKK